MDLELTLDAREALGKANKRLRRDGIVPGVVYGNGHDSVPVQVDVKTFETLYRSAGKTAVIKFRLPGANRATSGMIKSVQRNPLSGRPIHVDYYLVNLRQEMEVDVPLTFTGEAPAVESSGGTLLHNLSTIHVKALPNDIPQEVEVNVSVLTSLDVAIHVRDLNLNRDLVTVLTDGETLVATVVPPRVEEEPEAVAAVEGEDLDDTGPDGVDGGDADSASGDQAGDAADTAGSTEES